MTFQAGLHTVLTPDRLLLAHERVKPWIHRTPVLRCHAIEAAVGGNCELYFKCENLQKVGAFKIRGATNAVFSLTDEEASKGVCTHSSGNHGQGLALAARNRGVPAHIVMPSNSPAVKIAAVKGYGANVVLCKPTLAARETTLDEVVKQHGATVVHPYNDFAVIAGQSTAALELIAQVMEQAPPGKGQLDLVLAPVGGGGLLSGTALAVKYFSPGTTTIAVEPKGADDAWQSFKKGELVPQTNPQTVADGLRTSMGDKTFAVMREIVSDVVTVSEDAILAAQRLIMERMKIVVEPSSAVPLAALLEKKIDTAGKRIGIIVTGGNIELSPLFPTQSKL